MNIREWMDQNQNMVAVGAVVVMILALIFIFYQCKGTTRHVGAGQSYYYDTVTGKTFVSDANQIPPITSPDGNEAVRVHYYSCGSCSDSERFAGYFEKYPAEAKAKLEAAQSGENAMEAMYEYETQALISLDGKQWFPMYGPQPQEALDKKLQCPDGKRPRYCSPNN